MAQLSAAFILITLGTVEAGVGLRETGVLPYQGAYLRSFNKREIRCGDNDVKMTARRDFCLKTGPRGHQMAETRPGQCSVAGYLSQSLCATKV
jgi:hypothetical protein